MGAGRSVTENMQRAIVLLSGGLDSTTVLRFAQSQGWEVFGLSFNYGQRHGFELECAKKIASQYKIREHLVLDINMRKIGGSALTDKIKVPKNRSIDSMERDIPVTYVPARNTIFLSFALAWGEALGVSDIFLGVNALDYSGYPDCRPEYIEAYAKMANLATRKGIEDNDKFRFHTPLIKLSKAEIINLGLETGVDFAITNSCYSPESNGRPCGVCDSCILRAKGFSELGILDPLLLKFGLV